MNGYATAIPFKNLFMKKHYLVILACLILAVSCKKHGADSQPPVTDARSILLKEVTVSSLPSPYFQFAYDNAGFITHIDFASQLFSWQVQYKNNRVIRLINTNFNKDTLEYTYVNNRVAIIRHTSSQNGQLLSQYDFTYDNTGLLQQMRWWAFPQPGSDSVLSRKVNLVYYATGNLQEYDDYNLDTANTLVLTSTSKFTNYDEGVNVDDFYLLKNFFDDFLFLPQVKLQKNNPAHETIQTPNTDYAIDYTYKYNTNKLPFEKDYIISITRGTNTGQQYAEKDQFTY